MLSGPLVTMLRSRTEPVVAVLLMTGASFLLDSPHVELGNNRRLLRDHVQRARSLVAQHQHQHAPHHQFRRVFYAESLRNFSWDLSPHSLGMTVLVVEELKRRLSLKSTRFRHFQIW